MMDNIRAGTFAAILPRGEENAVKTEELRRRMGVSDDREIRRLISSERAAGAVILSSSKGYFLPDDGEKGRAECEAFIATVTAKGANTIKAVRSAKEFISAIPGQIGI